ncbi:MAG: AAA family ATPase [Hyphomicrobiaceae bacterium]
MKIRAIRLAECGRFRDPVALEGLSGGLDVLAGRNELGKSTILRAMRFALAEKHTTKSKDAESFRPYSGGAPTIEIDLEIDAKLWRVRKRYLAQRSAELRCLDDNNLLRGEDAEQKLVALLGGDDGKSRFPLLWLSQGEAIAPASELATANKGARPLLEAALASEIQAIAGGGRTRLLLERIKARRDTLVTEKQQRPRGPFEAAFKRVKDLTERHAAAAAQAQHANVQREQLARLRQRHEVLTQPEHRASLAQRLTTARTTRERAKEAASHLATARQAASLAEARLSAARNELTAFDRALAEHATIAQAIGQLASERAQLAGKLAAAEAKARDLAQARDALRTSQARDEAVLAASRQQARRSELATRIAVLDAKLGEAQTIEQRLNVMARELAGIVATPHTLAAARSARNEIGLLEARLSAAAVSVTMAYVSGGEGRVRIGGRALAEAERLHAVEPIVLEIAGVGRITIAPGGTDTIADVREDLAAQREQFAALLTRAGSDSLAALEAAVSRRLTLETQSGEDKARLSGLAPGGSALLLRERELLVRDLAGLPPPLDAASPMRSQGDMEAAIAKTRLRLQSAEAEAARAEAEVAQARSADAKLDTIADERRQRLEALATALPSEAKRDPHRAALAAKVAEGERALNDAVRQVTAWQETAPDASRLAALDAEVAAAETNDMARERELGEIATEVAHIEGQLFTLGNEDAEAEAIALAEGKAEAAIELARLEDEVAALQLLAREIDAEQALVQDRYLAPVTARLQPLLELVFPAASLALDASFAPEALVRGAASEPIDRLSDGTREQIAVLGRLAFARLLADGNHSTPLVLDDALVYSDDDRIEAMFRALQAASARHQVIMLTCRTRAFEGLGGARVDLVPWQMT